MQNKIFDYWIFDCPFHGYEQNVFCFRAFDERLKDNWFRYSAYKIGFTEEQRNEFWKDFVRQFGGQGIKT